MLLRALFVAATVATATLGAAATAVAAPPYANCDAAHADGASNMTPDHPGYRPPLDRDDDGLACEA